MKKTVCRVLMFSCICALGISCKKETATTRNEIALSSSASENLILPVTKFGVLANNVEGQDRITVARELNVAYVRDAIVMESYDGKAPMLDKYQANGYKILLNINYNASQKPNAFPMDMVLYKSILENILSKYRPEVAVIENEPANDGYYSGPIEDYFTELRTAIDVCHARGIKIADGALHTGMVMILVYQDYVTRGLQAQADNFAIRALSSNYLRAAQGKGSIEMNAKLEKCKKMISAYKAMGLDFVNIHWYEPLNENSSLSVATPGVVKEVADYLRRKIGKQVLTNEFGQTNQIPTLVSSQVVQFTLANLAYAIDFSGTGGGGVNSQALTNGIAILPNGESYRDAILH
jgi:hypothetical protein